MFKEAWHHESTVKLATAATVCISRRESSHSRRSDVFIPPIGTIKDSAKFLVHGFLVKGKLAAIWKEKNVMCVEPFLRCSNIEVSLNFYTSLLDFVVVQAPDPDPDTFLSMCAYLKRENSFIHLSQHAGDGVYGNVIYVQVSDLNKLYEKFLRNGLEVQGRSGITMAPALQTWGMREFYVADPDGNRIRFGQRIC